MLSKQDFNRGGRSHVNQTAAPLDHKEESHDSSSISGNMTTPDSGDTSGERRIGVAPIPIDITEYLNAEQQNTLQIMRYFGWELAFIRRSDINNILPVISHEQNFATEYATLEKDGDIIRSPDIAIRH